MGFEFLKLEQLKEWEKIVHENKTSIYNPNGFGVLQVSEFTIPKDYKLNLFDELYDFSSEYISNIKSYKNIKEVPFGLLLDKISDIKKTWLFAILNNDRNVLLLTYNSNNQDFFKEHEIILKIINSTTWS